jgi:hypothetical protein
MKNTNYHYIHFPASLLADVLERNEEALKDIITNYKDKETIKGRAHCSAKISMLNEFITKQKSEKEWIELICFLAIKSILGESRIIKTNYLHIFSRMLGLDSYDDRAKVDATKSQLKLIAQYTKKIDEVNKVDKSDIMRKAKMKGLLIRIEDKWHIKHYSRHMRGFYVSTKMSYDEMAKHCEERRETNRIKELKKAKKDAYLNYKATINPRNKSNEFE